MKRTPRRAASTDRWVVARRGMVEKFVAGRGVRDARVLEAILAVPRHEFVDEALAATAYGEHALPIGWGQTISQPYVVGRMTELLEIGSQDRVLEVGTGSGYQTAILCALARHVYSVERLPPLLDRATRTLRRIGAFNVSLTLADGSVGWSDRGPFERILVTAGSRDVPSVLVDQLTPGGRLVIPSGGESEQRLLLVTRSDRGEVREEDAGPCSFVKLIGRHGWPE